MKKLVMVVAALGVAVVLSACGSSSTSGEAARMIAGQVADYNGPAGVLEADVDTFGDNPDSVGVGSIDADGNFTFELDATVSESALTELGTLEECPDVRVSDPKARLLYAYQFSVLANSGIAGYLDQVEVDTSGSERISSTTNADRMYVDRNVSIKGSCNTAALGDSEEATFNLNLKQGWNVYAERTKYNVSGATERTDFFSVSASDIEWSYLTAE